MPGEIIVTIDKFGDTVIEVDGVAGRRCEQLTKPIEEALGTVTSCTAKPELYHEPIQQRNQLRQ